MKILFSSKSLSMTEILAETELSRYKVSNILKSLASRSLAQIEGNGRGTRYRKIPEA